MKKISLVLGMLLAVGLLATSCKQPSDPDLSKEDLNETDWLVGTWEETNEYDMDVSYDGDVPEEVKKAFEENYKKPEPKTITRTVTAETAPAMKAELEGYIAMAEKGEITESQAGITSKYSVSVKINKDKTEIVMYTDGTVEMTENGANGAKATISMTTKQTFSKK